LQTHLIIHARSVSIMIRNCNDLSIFLLHLSFWCGVEPPLTPPSAALARVTKTLAIHQDASRPRTRASVGCMGC
jgi:hypothetical protein